MPAPEHHAQPERRPPRPADESAGNEYEAPLRGLFGDRLNLVITCNACGPARRMMNFYKCIGYGGEGAIMNINKIDIIRSPSIARRMNPRATGTKPPFGGLPCSLCVYYFVNVHNRAPTDMLWLNPCSVRLRCWRRGAIYRALLPACHARVYSPGTLSPHPTHMHNFEPHPTYGSRLPMRYSGDILVCRLSRGQGSGIGSPGDADP